MAGTVSSSKPPYDPVKAIEGMFSGAVTRIGYIFQDPANYGPSSKAVLGATSKRFQDVLDDCEVQILDAKSYLEHQLTLSKSRREAKAQEAGATAKRKLDELNSTDEKNGHEEVENERDAKRQKVDAQIVEDQPSQQMLTDESPKAQVEIVDLPKENDHEETAIKPEFEVEHSEEQPEAAPKPPSKPRVTIPKVPPDLSTELRPQTSEGLPKITPQDTPANDAFNFESMFGEPSADAGDGTGNNLNFDLDLNADSFGDNANLDTSSLDNLLPGLETYASQAGEDGGLDFNVANPSGDGLTGMDENMELPDLGNSFDDFFNENNLGGGDGGDEMMNDSTFNIDEQLNFFD